MKFRRFHHHHQNYNNFQSISPLFMLFLLSQLFLLLIIFEIKHCDAETIHGTTILNWPYVNQKPNGQFEGFCIDLLNELAPLMGVAYTLSVVPDGQYGGWISNNGSVNGLIGQVMRREVDFAIGDLTVLTNRARFVDFTSSFLDYGLAALVRRDILKRYGEHIKTFKDLSEQTSIRYGVKKHGANLPLFHDSPIVAKMYSFMDTHPSVFVEGEKEGLHRVKTDRYAFITESPFVEYVVQRDCDLVAIDDRRRNFQFEYAIAVQKSSPLKERFNRALRQLKLDGKLRELKDKYWLNPKRNCPDDPGYDPSRAISGSEVNFSNDQNNLSINQNNNINNRFDGGNVRGVVGINRDDSIGGNRNVGFDGHRDGSGQIDSNRLRFTNRNNNNNINGDDNRLRIGGRIQPHDRVDEEDVELIRPRPDSATRTRRPVINRRRGSSPANVPIQFVSSFFWLIIILMGTLMQMI